MGTSQIETEAEADENNERGVSLFARAQKVAREARGLTQRQLGELCGVDKSQIYRRETSEGHGLETALESTARGLGIGVRQLLLEYLRPRLVAEMTFAPEEVGEVRVLARVVRNVRLSRGLSQDDLAAKIGTEQPTLSKLESGASAMNEATITKIAEALGMRVDTFVLRGLTYTPEAPERIDQAAVRERYLKAVAGGHVKPIRLAADLGIHRSRLTRFAAGESIGDEAARGIDAVLSMICPRCVPASRLVALIAPDGDTWEGTGCRKCGWSQRLRLPKGKSDVIKPVETCSTAIFNIGTGRTAALGA